MRQTTDARGFRTRVLYMLAVSSLVVLVPWAQGSQWHPIWRELYMELHEGASPSWNTFDDVRAWAGSESERLEPIVLEILRGDRPSTNWGIGLMVGRVIPSDRICDTVLDRAEVQQALSQAESEPAKRFSAEASTLTHVIDICTGARDERVAAIVLGLLTVDDQSCELIEHGVASLRDMGDIGAIHVLRTLALRKKDEQINRLCALAEKAIDARAQGRDLFADAEEALAKVTAEFLHAIEERDFAAFVALQPYGLRRSADEGHLKREMLEHSSVPDIVRALKDVAGREQFQIDRDRYEAKLVANGRYEFTYVLEVDGWKISGPIRVGP